MNHAILLAQSILFAQTGGDNASASGEEVADKQGQVDVSTATIWETVDNMIDGFLERLPFIVMGVVIFIVFFVLAKLARKLIRKWTDNRESANLGRVLGRIAQWVFIFLGLVIAITVIAPTVTPGKLLASLGIGGVAIGFAFKDILQNFMAGLLILLREPFKIGDQIVSGDFEGTVEAIETRATMIKTYDGRRVVIPNSQIYTNPVVVNTAYDARREQYDVGIGYGDDMRKAIEVILQTVKGVEGVLSDPAPDVLVVELAGSTVNLRARWWTQPTWTGPEGVLAIKNQVIAAIKEALDKAAIDMPYPTQVMLFHDQTEASDGDRTRQREGWPAGDDPPQAQTIAGAVTKRTRAEGDRSANNGEPATSGAQQA